MREHDLTTHRSKAPILALLIAGLTAGGAWEIVAHMDGGETEPTIIEVLDALEATLEEPVEPAPPVVLIPPPPVPEPVKEKQDLAAEPTFTPFTVAPGILNRDEVVAAMDKAYPPLLRDAGISGTTRVYFFIDADGTVVRTLIDVSSGRDELDAAALSVADVYRFSPALMRDEPVPVWVSFQITFQAR